MKKIPKHLSAESKKLCKYIIDNFELEEYHHHLVILACEARDRGKQARKSIEQNGLTMVDKYGVIKSRPEVQIERDSRISFARLIRELNLSEESGEKRMPALKYGGK
jgi:phage terminase small subunit